MNQLCKLHNLNCFNQLKSQTNENSKTTHIAQSILNGWRSSNAQISLTVSTGKSARRAQWDQLHELQDITSFGEAWK